METPLRILLLEDVPNDAELERLTLKSARIACETRCVATRADFLDQLDTFDPDLVLSDFTLPGFDGLSALELARDRQPDLPFIFVSGTIGEERAVEALKRGATDYVVKTNLARLPAVVVRAMREADERRHHAREAARHARLARLRAMQSSVASAIVRIRDPHALFQAICTHAVEHGGFALAWVGRPERETGVIEPVVWSGRDEVCLDELATRSESGQQDAGEEYTAFLRGEAVVIEDIQSAANAPARQAALVRGYRSMTTLPLIAEGGVAALFSMYATEPGFFGPEESQILAGLADDLSFALNHRAKEERLSYFAYHDVLTGLPNRRLFHEHLEQELARARGLRNTVAVVFIDLDQFKAVNDTLGHNAGDRLLKEVGSRILACVREGDMVARLGGDEFVMVLPMEPGQDDLESMMQRVAESVSQPVDIRGRRLVMTCSIGSAVYPQDGGDIESLVRSADKAMYRVKEQGCRNLHLFDDAAVAAATGCSTDRGS
jgi:diguanylate cyclase (GGDEF)-like protein